MRTAVPLSFIRFNAQSPFISSMPKPCFASDFGGAAPQQSPYLKYNIESTTTGTDVASWFCRRFSDDKNVVVGQMRSRIENGNDLCAMLVPNAVRVMAKHAVIFIVDKTISVVVCPCATEERGSL